MIAVRPERATDRPAVRAVVGRAFAAQPEVVRLVDLLGTGPTRLSLVAVSDDGAVLGHVMLSRGWIDADHALVEVLILSPLSVDPSVQRQGIGGTLVRAALDGAAALGAVAVFLEGSPDYYPRFGFVPGSTHGFTPPSKRIPDPAFQVVPLPGLRPEVTGALVYPEAFWVMDCVGRRTPPA